MMTMHAVSNMLQQTNKQCNLRLKILFAVNESSEVLLKFFLLLCVLRATELAMI